MEIQKRELPTEQGGYVSTGCLGFVNIGSYIKHLTKAPLSLSSKNMHIERTTLSCFLRKAPGHPPQARSAILPFRLAGAPAIQLVVLIQLAKRSDIEIDIIRITCHELFADDLHEREI